MPAPILPRGHDADRGGITRERAVCERIHNEVGVSAIHSCRSSACAWTDPTRSCCRSAQAPTVSLPPIDDLVQSLAAAEADAAIEADGAVVLSGDFEEGAVHAGALDTVQRLEQEGAAQSAAAMARHDSEVLNRARARTFAQALDRAAKARVRGHQPRRRR